MRKSSLMIAAFGCCLAPLFAQQSDNPAQAIAILNASIQAHGGLSAVSAVADTKSTGRVTTFKADGATTSFDITVYTRGFDQLRTELQGTNLSKLYVSNGTAGWAVRNGKKKALTAEEAARIIEFNPIVGLFGAFRQDRLQLDYRGIIPASGGQFHHVTALRTDAGGAIPGHLSSPLEIAIDVATNRVASISFFGVSPKGANPDEREEYVYSDFRLIGDLVVPFLITHVVNNKKVAEIALDRFELTQHGSIFQEP